jgi:phosphoribosylformylglycinamidine synthase
MGIAIHEKDVETLRKVADRERAPMYVVGKATGDHKFSFTRSNGSLPPVDLRVNDLFGSSPKTIIKDQSVAQNRQPLAYGNNLMAEYVRQVLQLEGVACKDWLTNKVDRSVTGRVATQQTCGAIQLPLNNVSVMALDFQSNKGVATSIGHAPGIALQDPAAGSRMAIAEALTNLVWAPLTNGLKGVSLSANWMWPAKNAGENARLYKAVKAVSDFACALKINVPTGKDSLSMTQKYPDGNVVYSPGTVIISTVAEVEDIRKTVSPDLKPIEGSLLIHIDFSRAPLALGGSSFAQVISQVGNQVPDVADADYFARAFEAVQKLIKNNHVLAGHDISSGGLVTTLLEMCFPTPGVGIEANFSAMGDEAATVLFAENPGLVLQVEGEDVLDVLTKSQVTARLIGKVSAAGTLDVDVAGQKYSFGIDEARALWFKTSYLFDKVQRPKGHAERRRDRFASQPLHYTFQHRFDGKYATYGIDPKRRKSSGIRAAIIREKGVNGDREMAYALYLAGFDVKDVHMTDLVSGREDLSGVNMIVFVGGFSNSDVLGSAKGWAGAFLYNPRAKAVLDNFYARPDTLSLGVCNGCQLMMELGLVYREMEMGSHPKMHHNGSGKFESTFVTLSVPNNNSVMLSTYAGAQLGVWLAHGEGQFVLGDVNQYSVAATYTYPEYPGNPNDSEGAVAALCSRDGRHLAIMPHIERTLFPWNWPHYTRSKQADEVGPWVEAFVNARDWVKRNNN